MVVQAGARFAEGLLKALGVQQALVVGHSAGALTAMELFKRCVHLLLLEAPCPAACLPHCHMDSASLWELLSCCTDWVYAKFVPVVFPYHIALHPGILGCRCCILASASCVSVVHSVGSLAWYDCMVLLHSSMTE